MKCVLSGPQESRRGTSLPLVPPGSVWIIPKCVTFHLIFWTLLNYCFTWIKLVTASLFWVMCIPLICDTSWTEQLHHKPEEAMKSFPRTVKDSIWLVGDSGGRNKSLKKTSWISLNSSCKHLILQKAPRYSLLFPSYPTFHPQLHFPNGFQDKFSALHYSL